MIGDDVEIMIVDVRGDKVRLGITAPKCIPVHRREIYDAIQRERTDKKEPKKQQEKEPQAKSEEISGDQETHNQPIEKPKKKQQ